MGTWVTWGSGIETRGGIGLDLSDTAEAEYPSYDGCRDGLKRLTTRGTRDEGFGELVKLGSVHLLSLLCVWYAVLLD